ncbi:MAG: hypothetical protein GY750_04930, partial [Lentisphaerae bacterium]|nr:hypothetical protein [Lentisphaerota bacterium]
MSYKIITAPAVEPLLLATVKTRLSISDTLDDPDINALIQAAREQAEEYMGRSIITQTLEIAFNCFPDDIELVRGPVQSITSVKYIDGDDTEQTVTATNYMIDDYGPKDWLRLDYGKSWPASRGHTNDVKIRYVTGWGDAGTDVPEDIRTAMLLLIGHWIRFQAEAESGVGPT